MLAAERPDVVSVATPDATHVQMLELVLETPSVRAVLVEKPLALEPEVAETIVEHARRRGVLLAVNYSRRFAPSHRRLKAWLAGKPLGTIEMIRGLYVRGIKHNGTHWLDLARYLVGEVIGIRGSGPVAPEQVDATIDVDLRFASGARGHLQGLRGGEYSLFEMDLVGSLGRLQISDSGERFQAFRGQPSRRFPGFQELAEMASPDGGLTDLLLHAATDLTEALENGRAPACSGEDGVIALRLATEALATARAEDRTHAALGC